MELLLVKFAQSDAVKQATNWGQALWKTGLVYFLIFFVSSLLFDDKTVFGPLDNNRKWTKLKITLGYKMISA
jgi:hypothetical protein